jgi:hypothetical protein
VSESAFENDTDIYRHFPNQLRGPKLSPQSASSTCASWDLRGGCLSSNIYCPLLDLSPAHLPIFCLLPLLKSVPLLDLLSFHPLQSSHATTRRTSAVLQRHLIDLSWVPPHRIVCETEAVTIPKKAPLMKDLAITDCLAVSLAEMHSTTLSTHQAPRSLG